MREQTATNNIDCESATVNYSESASTETRIHNLVVISSRESQSAANCTCYTRAVSSVYGCTACIVHRCGMETCMNKGVTVLTYT